MTRNPIADVFAALKAEPDLTVTGLCRRLPYSRLTVMTVVRQAEMHGHLTATFCPIEPGQSAPAVRYRLTTGGPA